MSHATDVDGWYDEQNQEDNELLATMGRKVRLPIGRKGDGLLLLVVRTIAGNDFSTVFADKFAIGLVSFVIHFVVLLYFFNTSGRYFSLKAV